VTLAIDPDDDGASTGRSHFDGILTAIGPRQIVQLPPLGRIPPAVPVDIGLRNAIRNEGGQIGDGHNAILLVPDFTIEAGIVGEPPGLRHYTIMAVGPVDDLRKTVRLTADHELAGQPKRPDCAPGVASDRCFLLIEQSPRIQGIRAGRKRTKSNAETEQRNQESRCPSSCQGTLNQRRPQNARGKTKRAR
jgi:hypothetical protein